ncbi:CU044_2847 family protein [Streptomyces yangpuensis]|uniref:CU044_2847 family protein n=1 Tax=Streptomyces yangpuensis TaxID=1648182 RepID=UPI0037F1D11B
MTTLARIPLTDGGALLVEAPAASAGPVKAGRIGDAIHDLPVTLQEALHPITEAAQAALDQLRKAGPDAITVEFGVDLAVEAGAVITKSSANCHLKVTVMWTKDAPDSSDRDREPG